MELKHIFGKNVKYYRYNKHLTQAQLAEKADISVDYLSCIERGKYGANFDLIETLATIFNIPPYKLFLPLKETNLPRRVDMQ